MLNLKIFKDWYPVYKHEAAGMDIVEGFSKDRKIRMWFAKNLPPDVMELIEANENSISYNTFLSKIFPKTAILIVSLKDGLLTWEYKYKYKFFDRFAAKKFAPWERQNVDSAIKYLLEYAYKTNL